MSAMAYFAVDRPREIADADMQRIAFADGPDEEDWPEPYAPEFLDAFKTEFCYDRFWTKTEPAKYYMMTTRYVCSGWSWAAIGESGGRFFVPVALPHFQHQYFQLGLIVHLQHATLLLFSERLSEAVAHARKEPEKYRKMIERVARDFAIFTDRYWLTDVTSQVQGQDLYQLWVKQLRLRELYAQVRDEVEFVNSTLQTQAQALLAERADKLAQAQALLAERADKLAHVGYPLLLCSAIFGLWGSNWLGDTKWWHWRVYQVSLGFSWPLADLYGGAICARPHLENEAFGFS